MTQAAASASGQKPGLLQGLAGLKPAELEAKGVNIFDPSLTVEDLWGDDAPSGGALLDAVINLFNAGTHNVPWFTYTEGAGGTGTEGTTSGMQKNRSIVKAPLSREIQESTVESYKRRIFAESISQVAAGDLSTTLFTTYNTCFGSVIGCQYLTPHTQWHMQ